MIINDLTPACARGKFNWRIFSGLGSGLLRETSRTFTCVAFVCYYRISWWVNDFFDLFSRGSRVACARRCHAGADSRASPSCRLVYAHRAGVLGVPRGLQLNADCQSRPLACARVSGSKWAAKLAVVGACHQIKVNLAIYEQSAAPSAGRCRAHLFAECGENHVSQAASVGRGVHKKRIVTSTVS